MVAAFNKPQQKPGPTPAETFVEKVNVIATTLEQRTALTSEDESSLNDLKARYARWSADFRSEARSLSTMPHIAEQFEAEASDLFDQMIAIAHGSERRQIGEHFVDIPALESQSVRAALRRLGNDLIDRVGNVERIRVSARQAIRARHADQERVALELMAFSEISHVVSAILLVEDESLEHTQAFRQWESEGSVGQVPNEGSRGDSTTLQALTEVLKARFVFHHITGLNPIELAPIVRRLRTSTNKAA